MKYTRILYHQETSVKSSRGKITFNIPETFKKQKFDSTIASTDKSRVQYKIAYWCTLYRSGLKKCLGRISAYRQVQRSLIVELFLYLEQSDISGNGTENTSYRGLLSETYRIQNQRHITMELSMYVCIQPTSGRCGTPGTRSPSSASGQSPGSQSPPPSSPTSPLPLGWILELLRTYKYSIRYL